MTHPLGPGQGPRDPPSRAFGCQRRALPVRSSGSSRRIEMQYGLDCSRPVPMRAATIPLMPIRREHRFFYPIDWRELSAVIRFGRARGRCEACARPHGHQVFHLGDGRWWDDAAGFWRDGRGRRIRVRTGYDDILARVRITRVVLATAHRDHDTANNGDANLAAFCQRCHMLHDAPEHRRRRWRTLFRRKALGDLFLGPYRGS